VDLEGLVTLILTPGNRPLQRLGTLGSGVGPSDDADRGPSRFRAPGRLRRISPRKGVWAATLIPLFTLTASHPDSTSFSVSLSPGSTLLGNKLSVVHSCFYPSDWGGKGEANGVPADYFHRHYPFVEHAELWQATGGCFIAYVDGSGTPCANERDLLAVTGNPPR
jgi:hypothetical protein